MKEKTMPEPRQGTYGYVLLLIFLCLATTVAASIIFERAIYLDGITAVDVAILGVFIILYFWISIGFWTAVFGFVRGLFTLARRPGPREFPADMKLPKTAILMPIYNEDVVGVFSRLEAMYNELAASGKGEPYDFFILSDTTDPDIWLEEEEAWAAFRATHKENIGFYYRRRSANTERKSGNVKEFCLNWGKNYQYMIVLDADSLMAAATIIEMTCVMESDHKIGILQSAPVPVNQRTFFGRLQQFSAHLYGPIFTAGYSLWSQDEGTYWGHNAIIRVRAFMKCCGLPLLPGKAPLGGEILSHDFVEAAFIRRKGWKVIVDHNLSGSYEECPTNLIDFAKRDQRWCQGNLQHLRMVLHDGLRTVNRAQLGIGAMSYIASPLWAFFLILVVLTGLGGDGSIVKPEDQMMALGLLMGTMLLLLLPKFLALLLLYAAPERARSFAGVRKATLSVIFEMFCSIIMAPVLMAFHTTFVIAAFFGHSVQWKTQKRTDNKITFATALRVHGPHTIAGLAGALMVSWVSPGMIFWMSTVIVPLVLSVPVSMILSSGIVGKWLIKNRLLMIPQEINPPQLLRQQHYFKHVRARAMVGAPHPFTRAVVIPAFNHQHLAMLPVNPARPGTDRMERLKRVALSGGAVHLSREERKEIISDPAVMRWLHSHAWQDWPPDLLERCSKHFMRLLKQKSVS